jgi:hypothetical protein
MSRVSYVEDIDRARHDAVTMAERIRTNAIPLAEAERQIKGLLKRCKYVIDTTAEIKRLHSDLSRETRNRIYSLKIELADAIEKLQERELAHKKEVAELQARLSVAIRNRSTNSTGKRPKSRRKKIARR